MLVFYSVSLPDPHWAMNSKKEDSHLLIFESPVLMTSNMCLQYVFTDQEVEIEGREKAGRVDSRT